MKKFLTMLLALSVVFTYTFGAAGSVFAAETPVVYNGTTYANQAAANAAYLADVDNAEQAALETLGEQYDLAVASVKADKEHAATDGSTRIAASYWLAQMPAVKTEATNKITEETKNLKSVGDVSVATAQPTESSYSSVDMTASDMKDAVYGDTEAHKRYAVAALTAAFDSYKAAIVAGIGAIDTKDYSTTAYTADNYTAIPNYNTYTWSYPVLNADGSTTTKAGYVAKTNADNTVAYAIAKVNEVVLESTDTTVTTIEAKYADLATAYTTYVEYTPAADKYAIKSTIKFYTSAKETADDSKKDATKAQQKAILSNDIAAFKNTDSYLDATATSSPTKAQVEAYIAAHEEAATYLIEGGNGYTTTVLSYDVDYAKNAKIAAEAKADAAAYIAEKNEDGQVVYDAETVNENLDTILREIYGAMGTVYTYDKTALIANDAEIDYVTEFTKENKKAVAEKAYTDAEDSYYALEYAQYKTALDAYKAAVDAATTDTALTKADTDFTTALDKILTKTGATGSVEYLYTTTLNSALSDAQAMAAQYVGGLNAGKADADKITYNANAVANFLKESGARTAKEIVAKYDALKADIVATKTDSAKVADITAVKNAIAALPAILNITADNRTAILAAYNAYADLSPKTVTVGLVTTEVTSTEVTTLTNAYNKIRGIDDTAITAAAKAIQADFKDDKVTVADKDAVKAAQALADAYSENYNGATAAKAEFLADAAKTIRDLEAKAVVAAIKALPTEITAADKDAVKAAQDAYDAFVAEYTDVVGNYDAAKVLANAPYSANVAKLEAASATIAELTKYTDKDVKADLFDMSRKATIWRTSKTSIRVTAVGSVANITDNGYTVEYKFYKKAPGAKAYKLIKTTTSNKYTYTNLKKGTNKFQVKVVVKDADGKVVASKWTYYRAAKVK